MLRKHLVEQPVQPGDAAPDPGAVKLEGQDGIVPGDFGADLNLGCHETVLATVPGRGGLR